MKNAQLLVCPSGSGLTPCGRPFRPDWGDEPGENPEWKTSGLSYGFNIYIGAHHIGIARVKKPAEVVLIGESLDCGYVANCGNYSGCPYVRTKGGVRHNNGANAVFCDGHAKWLKRDTYELPATWQYWLE